MSVGHAAGFRLHAPFGRLMRHIQAVKNVHLVCHWMCLHFLHRMVECVASNGRRKRADWRSKVPPFSLSCKRKCSAVPNVISVFISIPYILIVLYDPKF